MRVKVTLICRDTEGDSAFVPGKQYSFRLEQLPENGLILLKGEKVTVAYKDWPAFHRKWQVVAGALPVGNAQNQKEEKP